MNETFFSKKILLIVGGVLLFFLIILIVMFVFVTNKKPTIQPTFTTPQTPTNNYSKLLPSPTTLSKSAISSKITSWLRGMRSPTDNQYYYALVCDAQGHCKNSPTDKQVSITALWSRYRRYKISGDQSELTQIATDILQYSKRSEIEDYWQKVYQPDFWHCKLLYDMAHDNIFSKEYQDALYSICQNNSYFLSRIELANIANENKLDKIYPQDKRRFAIYNTMISDFVSLYRWTKDERLLKIAKMYFTNAKNYYLANNLLPSDSSYLTIASLDLYLATNDKIYLDFANNLFNRFTDSDRQNLTLDQLAELCLSSQYYYDNISKNQKYQIIKNDSVSRLIERGWDSQKGAFHGFTEKDKSYETRNNALINVCLMN